MKYFSMFSGIGGFELGLANSSMDFECVGFSEVDIYAKAIYTNWFPDHEDWGDATEIKAEQLPEFDFLVGGFPCQAFSNAGKRLGFDDTRGTLFFEIVRVLKEKRPKYFLLENVKGLLSHDGGNTFTRMLRILSELGYDVEWEIINSKLFVPQNRERVYLKGYFREECGREIFCQGRHCREITDGVDVEMKWSPTSTRVSKFVDKDGVSLTLTGEGQNSGRNQLIKLNDSDAQAQKIYDENGLASTLCGTGGGQGGKTGLYKVGNINPSKNGMAGNVYDTDGVSRAITSGEGGMGGRTGLYKIGNQEVYATEVNDDKIVTSTKDGDSFAVSTKIRSSKFEKMKENYVIEKGIKVVGNTSAGNHHGKLVYDTEGISPTLVSGSLHKNGLRIKTNTTKGYDEANEGDSVRLCHPSSKTARGRVQGDNTGALSSSSDWGVVDKDFRIRRLTPIECERLQGFPDDYSKYGADGELISDTQRYKCLGNAVTVPVITHIVECMFNAKS